MDVLPNILDIQEARIPRWAELMEQLVRFHTIHLMSADMNTIVLTWL